MSAHSPDRPSWDCVTCHQQWPCPGAKRELVATYAGDPIGLCVYLGTQMVHAFSDLPDIPADLHGRFIGWARLPETQRAPRRRASSSRVRPAA